MAIPNNKLKDVSFSTQFRYANVKLRSHIDFSMNTWEAPTITIPHNLGYKPFFRLYIQVPGNGRVYYMESGPGTYGFGPDKQIENIGSDANNIYVRIADYGTGGGTGRIYYRIYEDAQ